MTAQIIEFTPDNTHTPTVEKVCSFCGTPKGLTPEKFLVNGLEADICVACANKMYEMLHGEKESEG